MLNKFLLACVGVSLVLYVFLDYKTRLEATQSNDLIEELEILKKKEKQYALEKRQKDLFFNEKYITFVKNINAHNKDR